VGEWETVRRVGGEDGVAGGGEEGGRVGDGESGREGDWWCFGLFFGRLFT